MDGSDLGRWERQGVITQSSVSHHASRPSYTSCRASRDDDIETLTQRRSANKVFIDSRVRIERGGARAEAMTSTDAEVVVCVWRKDLCPLLSGPGIELHWHRWRGRAGRHVHGRLRKYGTRSIHGRLSGSGLNRVAEYRRKVRSRSARGRIGRALERG